MSDAPDRARAPLAAGMRRQDPERDPAFAREERAAARNPSVRQEPDSPAYRRIILTLIGALGVGGILILATTLILQTRVRERRPEGLPRPDTAHEGPDRVAGVFQTQIFDEVSATEVKRKRLDRLEAYGWVSRPHGIVRIPIDSAIAIVLEQQAARAAGGDTARTTPANPGPPRGRPTLLPPPGGLERGGVQRKRGSGTGAAKPRPAGHGEARP